MYLMSLLHPDLYLRHFELGVTSEAGERKSNKQAANELSAYACSCTSLCVSAAQFIYTQFAMADSGSLSLLSVEEFTKFLKESGYEKEVVKKFIENKISGAAFLKLKEHHLKELVPVIGLRLSILELLDNVTQVLLLF